MKYGWLILIIGFSGCVPAQIRQATSQPVVIPVTTLPVTSPCGEALKREPPSFPLQQGGTWGVWVAGNRYKCMVVRQRIALNCRLACERRVQVTTRAYQEAYAKQEALWEQERKQLQSRLRLAVIQNYIYPAIALVVGAGLATVIVLLVK